MSTLRLSWPHNVSVKVDDPDTSRQMFIERITRALDSTSGGLALTLPDRTIIVSYTLLTSALIEITE